MTLWKIIREPDGKGTIIKDGVPYEDLDISWLPSTIRVVQGQSDGSAYVENINTETDFVSDLSAQSWYSDIGTTWQNRHDNPPEEPAFENSGG